MLYLYLPNHDAQQAKQEVKSGGEQVSQWNVVRKPIAYDLGVIIKSIEQVRVLHEALGEEEEKRKCFVTFLVVEI